MCACVCVHVYGCMCACTLAVNACKQLCTAHGPYLADRPVLFASRRLFFATVNFGENEP